MPRVRLASAIAKHLGHQGEMVVDVIGGTVQDRLDDLFRLFPTLRGYVLDETGTIRHHVVAFVNGDVIRDKSDLSAVVPDDGELAIYQALSGG